MLLIQNNCRRNTNAQFFHLTSISKEVTSWRVNLIRFRGLLISAGFSSSILLQLILFAQLDFFFIANRIIQSCLLSLYTLPRSCIQWEDFCCGDETFSLAIFGRFHAGFLFLLLLLSLLSHEDMSQTNPLPPQNLPSFSKSGLKVPQGCSWNPETRILLLSRQEPKRIKPTNTATPNLMRQIWEGRCRLHALQSTTQRTGGKGRLSLWG